MVVLGRYFNTSNVMVLPDKSTPTLQNCPYFNTSNVMVLPNHIATFGKNITDFNTSNVMVLLPLNMPVPKL